MLTHTSVVQESLDADLIIAGTEEFVEVDKCTTYQVVLAQFVVVHHH